MRATGTIFIRDLKFSDIVPNTITIINKKLKQICQKSTTNSGGTLPLIQKSSISLIWEIVIVRIEEVNFFEAVFAVFLNYNNILKHFTLK